MGFEPMTKNLCTSWDLNPWPSKNKHSLDTKALNSVKCQHEKKTAPPEMAGVPLPTCSGGWAVHDPQQGSMVLFLHPVPYGKNRKIKLYKLKFINAYKICNTC
jgi:hypothetical protein